HYTTLFRSARPSLPSGALRRERSGVREQSALALRWPGNLSRADNLAGGTRQSRRQEHDVPPPSAGGVTMVAARARCLAHATDGRLWARGRSGGGGGRRGSLVGDRVPA